MREFLARNRLPYRWLDLEEDQEAEALLRSLGVSACGDAGRHLARGDVLRNPSQRRRGPARSGSRARGPPPPMLRPRGRRRRPGRPGRGASTAPPRASTRQAVDAVALGGQAGHLVADRELPRLPDRHLRRRAGRAGRDPGRASSARAWSCRREAVGPASRGRPLRRPARRRRRGQRPHGDRRHRRPLPRLAVPELRALRGRRRLLRRDRRSRRSCAPATRC